MTGSYVSPPPPGTRGPALVYSFHGEAEAPERNLQHASPFETLVVNYGKSHGKLAIKGQGNILYFFCGRKLQNQTAIGTEEEKRTRYINAFILRQ